jgi:hypothetical protein
MLTIDEVRDALSEETCANTAVKKELSAANDPHPAPTPR